MKKLLIRFNPSNPLNPCSKKNPPPVPLSDTSKSIYLDLEVQI